MKSIDRTRSPVFFPRMQFFMAIHIPEEYIYPSVWTTIIVYRGIYTPYTEQATDALVEFKVYIV